MRTFTSFDELTDAIGQDLGTSEWLSIEQDRVDQFAEATGDHQWIHVDVDRAAEGPFGGTIAHGYLTLSLIPFLGVQVFTLDTPGAKLNYGVNKVRVPSPVRVGSRVRNTVSVKEVTDLPSGKQLVLGHVIEIEGPDGQVLDKPACVAETVVLLLP
jgi:acyl dehydratase